MSVRDRRYRYPLLVSGLLLSLAAAGAHADSSWTLDASQWARPRSGKAVVSMRPLPQVVRTWSDAPTGHIVIHYPGGEDGELWASELRDWLIALGVPGNHLRRVAGAEPGSLRIEVVDGDGNGA